MIAGLLVITSLAVLTLLAVFVGVRMQSAAISADKAPSLGVVRDWVKHILHASTGAFLGGGIIIAASLLLTGLLLVSHGAGQNTKPSALPLTFWITGGALLGAIYQTTIWRFRGWLMLRGFARHWGDVSNAASATAVPANLFAHLHLDTAVVMLAPLLGPAVFGTLSILFPSAPNPAPLLVGFLAGEHAVRLGFQLLTSSMHSVSFEQALGKSYSGLRAAAFAKRWYIRTALEDASSSSILSSLTAIGIVSAISMTHLSQDRLADENLLLLVPLSVLFAVVSGLFGVSASRPGPGESLVRGRLRGVLVSTVLSSTGLFGLCYWLFGTTWYRGYVPLQLGVLASLFIALASRPSQPDNRIAHTSAHSGTSRRAGDSATTWILIAALAGLTLWDTISNRWLHFSTVSHLSGLLVVVGTVTILPVCHTLHHGSWFRVATSPLLSGPSHISDTSASTDPARRAPAASRNCSAWCRWFVGAGSLASFIVVTGSISTLGSSGPHAAMALGLLAGTALLVGITSLPAKFMASFEQHLSSYAAEIDLGSPHRGPKTHRLIALTSSRLLGRASLNSNLILQASLTAVVLLSFSLQRTLPAVFSSSLATILVVLVLPAVAPRLVQSTSLAETKRIYDIDETGNSRQTNVVANMAENETTRVDGFVLQQFAVTLLVTVAAVLMFFY